VENEQNIARESSPTLFQDSTCLTMQYAVFYRELGHKEFMCDGGFQLISGGEETVYV
jgi:hypothetical protein